MKEIQLSEDLKEKEEAIVKDASEIINTRAIHNKLGVTQRDVDTLRRGTMNIRKALYILFLSGKLTYEK